MREETRRFIRMWAPIICDARMAPDLRLQRAQEWAQALLDIGLVKAMVVVEDGVSADRTLFFIADCEIFNA